MADTGNSRRIPHFISAGSLVALQRAMLVNNIKSGIEHRYFDIQKDGNKWVAFYYKVADLEAPLARSVKGGE